MRPNQEKSFGCLDFSKRKEAWQIETKTKIKRKLKMMEGANRTNSTTHKTKYT